MSSTHGQISPLRPVTRHITGHNDAGRAVIHSSTPAEWESHEAAGMAFNVVYTSQFPADLNEEADVKKHEQLTAEPMGLVNPGGTSLDYGVVLEGEVEMILEDSEPVILKRGDVAVQRATMHGWRNPSETEWTRMLFVLQDCQKLAVNGKQLGEDLGPVAGVLKPSGN
ncbi:unnamed protein product [Penicillium bialowiezense]